MNAERMNIDSNLLIEIKQFSSDKYGEIQRQTQNVNEDEIWQSKGDNLTFVQKISIEISCYRLEYLKKINIIYIWQTRLKAGHSFQLSKWLDFYSLFLLVWRMALYVFDISTIDTIYFDFITEIIPILIRFIRFT